MEGNNLADKSDMAGIGLNVRPTGPSSEHVVGASLDRDNDASSCLAELYSVYRMGNHVVARYSGMG